MKMVLFRITQIVEFDIVVLSADPTSKQVGDQLRVNRNYNEQKLCTTLNHRNDIDEKHRHAKLLRLHPIKSMSTQPWQKWNKMRVQINQNLFRNNKSVD